MEKFDHHQKRWGAWELKPEETKEGLLMKSLWRFTKEEHVLWGTVIKAKYGKRRILDD